jgi:hypothetical protein
MRQPTRAASILALATPVLFAVAATRPAQIAVVEGMPCTASLTPDSAKIQPEPSRLGYALSEPIGMVGAATAQDESGLEVVSVDGEAKTVTVNTSGAAEGSWSLTFSGEEGKACVGTLRVVKSSSH